MKDNKGFTLVELLVVIAIIGVLAILIVPSVIKVNSDVNERLYNQKKEYIVTAAELYGSNNPDIFNGSDVAYVAVYQLIDANYLESDVKKGSGSCVESSLEDGNVATIANGCIVNPKDSSKILNNTLVKLTKKTVGVVGTFESEESDISSESDTLVQKVCDGFGKEYDGYYVTSSGEYKQCKCNANNNDLIAVEGSDVPSACILVSNKESGEINNWLKYGSSSANWRVIGLYKVNGSLSAKMITSNVVN